jgi:hypothetical protein
VTKKDSLESKVAEELIRTMVRRPGQRLRIDDLGGDTMLNISPLLNCLLKITTTGNNNYDNEICGPCSELEFR